MVRGAFAENFAAKKFSPQRSRNFEIASEAREKEIVTVGTGYEGETTGVNKSHSSADRGRLSTTTEEDGIYTDKLNNMYDLGQFQRLRCQTACTRH